MSLLKNGKCSSKYEIIINILLHYSKYKKILSKKVRIINMPEGKYKHLEGRYGYVKDFEFYNFKKPLIVCFPELSYKEKCFGFEEIMEWSKNYE